MLLFGGHGRQTRRIFQKILRCFITSKNSLKLENSQAVDHISSKARKKNMFVNGMKSSTSGNRSIGNAVFRVDRSTGSAL